MKKTNILKAINRVMKAVGYIKKNANVQGYKAVTHDEVTAKIRPAMIEAGIVFNISIKNSEMFEGGRTQKGNIIWFYKAIYEAIFYEVESGEFITEQVEAHALDHGDKAPGKALSYATKAILLKTFLLETGENDESRQEIDQAMEEQKAIARSQVLHSIGALTEKTGTDISRAIAFVTGGKDEQLENLSDSQLQRINNSLLKKAESNQNV